MPIPSGHLDASSYALINGALTQAGYENPQVFFDTAFYDKFSQVKWTQFFTESAGSINKTYTQVRGNKTLPVMAAYVSWDAKGPKISTDSIAVTTDTMPRMKLSFDVNEKAMDEMQKIMTYYSGNADFSELFTIFAKNTVDLLRGIHAQISYTALQILSTGRYIASELNNRGGVTSLAFDFHVPDANKKLCGFGTYGKKYAWSSSSANPIGDLQDIMQYCEDNLIPIGEFCMNKATYNLMKNHASTKLALAMDETLGQYSEVNLAKYIVKPGVLTAYLDSLGLVPITVVDDAFGVQVFDPAKNEIVQKNLRGFADGVVVAKPAGPVGELQWSKPNLSWGTASNPVYTAEGGKFKVKELIDSDKESMEVEVSFTGITVPSRVEHLIYLDITQATA